MTDSPNELTVLDCTLRDGGYYNDWVFDPALVERYLSAMRAAAVDVVEIGFRQPAADRFLGAYAFSTDSFLKSLDLPRDLVVAVMSDAKVLLRDGAPAATVDRLYGDRRDSPVGIVRIAANVDEVEPVTPAVARLKEKGFTVCLNVMQIGSKPRDLIARIGGQAAAIDGLDVLYFADSFGNMTPATVTATVETLRTHWHGAMGIHTHDNMNNALANSLAALDAGVSWIDGTVLGMGRGAGNVAMEYLLHALQQRDHGTYRYQAILPVLLDDFRALQRAYGWGPNFLYYLAAQHEIHPTFLQRLQDAGQADGEAVVNALEYLSNAPSNAFTEETLGRAMRAESTEVPGTWSPAGWAEGRDVLLIAGGRGSSDHAEAIANFIRANRPRVICLNHVETVDPSLVDAYAVCHSSRLVRDLPGYRGLGRPIVLPPDELASFFSGKLGDEPVYAFGVSVRPGVLSAAGTGCTIPARKVAPYSLALAAGAGTRRIYLAGFDGFDGRDPRHQEMNEIIELFRASYPDIELVAITPSSYNVRQSSVYAY